MTLIKLGTGPAPTISHSTEIKCQYMFVSCKKTVSTPSSPLLLEGHSLEQVEMFKYLGVLLSHHLSWGEHVAFSAEDSIIMLQVVLYLNSKSPLLGPHLDYASAIWSLT